MPWYENDICDRLWYEELGSGPPLILLHGWCMSSAVWRFQFDALSENFRVIAPDLRGFGRSSDCSIDCNFSGFAADLAALIRHLDSADILLTGWSMGAQVALQALPLIREKLAGLVLVSATPTFIGRDDFSHALSRIEADGMALKVRRNIHRALTGFISRMFAPGELDDVALAGQVSDVLSTVPVPTVEVALQSLQALVDADMREIAAAVDLPTLIINGDSDIICLPEASAWLSNTISASRQSIFTGCGHALFLTCSSRFNAELTGFFRRISGRSI